MLNKYLKSFLLILVIIFSGIHDSSFAFEVKVHISGDSKKILGKFITSETQKIELKKDNNMILIKFDKEIKPIFNTMQGTSNRYITSAKLGKDNKTIIFTVSDANFVVKNISDKKNAIIEISNFNKAISIPRFDYTPTRRHLEKQQTPKTLTVPKTKKIKETNIIPPQDKKNKTLVKEDISPKKINNTQELADSTTILEKKQAVVKETNLPNLSKKDIRYDLSSSVEITKDNGVKWYFDWEEDVASAVFYRGNFLWVVFSKYKKVNLHNILQEQRAPILNAEQLDVSNYTILRFNMVSNKNIRTFKDGKKWVIELPPFDKDRNFSPSRIIAQYNSPFSRGYFFPIENKTETILRVRDPEIGDELSIIPLYEADYGIENKRSFVDFKLFKTAQGFVVTLLSDHTYIDIIKPGVEIIVPPENINKSDKKGYSKAPEEINSQSATNVDISKVQTLLSIPEVDNFNFTETLTNLNNNIMKATKHNKNAALLELSKYYFAQKMYKEAAAMLRIIAKEKYILEFNPQIRFLLGISNFMEGYYIESKKYFDQIDLTKLKKNEQEEIKFWQNLLHLQITGTGNPIDYINNKLKFAVKYPQDIKVEIALKNIEYYVDNDENMDVIKQLTQEIESNTIDPYIKNRVKYYQGLIAKNKKDYDLALKLWLEVSSKIDDRKNSMLAKFSYTTLLLDRGLINIKDAIHELNSLRMRWRGSYEESKLLRKIGDLYNIEGDYVNALRTWKRLINNYTTSNESLFIASEMSNAFINLFTKKQAAYNISDLQAIALFYEFKELIPIGSKGDEIIRYVAKRMIKLDLLTHAASLLHHQVEYRLSGQERVNVASDLALVYLSNRAPQKALEILEQTERENIDSDNAIKRDYITAQAFLDLKQYKKAMKILQDDYSYTANEMKAYIFLVEKDWISLKRILLVSLNERANDIKILSSQEKQNIEKLAISYYMLNDMDGIESLKTNFRNHLTSNSETKTLLDFLLLNQDSVNYKKLEETVNYKEISTFVDKYKKALLAPDIL